MDLENFNFDPNDFSAESLEKNGTVIEPKPVKAAKEEDAEPQEPEFNESDLLDFSDLKEEEEPKKPSEKAQTQEPKTNSSSPNAMLVFAKTLEENGLISDFTDEDFEALVEETGSATDAIVELVNRTIGSTIEQHVQSKDAEYQEFVKMRDAGVDLNEYAKISKQAKGYSSYKLEDVQADESLQKKVITESLKLKGMSDDEIADTVESYEDTGKLGKRAEAALTTLHKYKEEQLKKLEADEVKRAEAAQVAVQQQLASIKKEIDDSSEIIPGIKHNKQTKDRLFDMITKPAGTINGQPVNAITLKMHENPTKYNLILAELQRLGVFDGKWDAITKVTKTKVVNDLEKVVNSGVDYKSMNSKGANEVYKALKEMK